MFASRCRFIPHFVFVAGSLSAEVEAAEAEAAEAEAAEPAVASEVSVGAADDRRAAAVLARLGEQAGESKTVAGWSTVVVGGAVTTAGIFVDRQYDASYGPVLWAGGAGLIAGGLVSLLLRPPIEAFAEEAASSPTGLQARWRTKAADARSRRETLGVIDLSLGAAGAVAATVLAAGVGDLSRADRAEWVALTAVFGGGSVASGLVRLLVESDIENGYAVAYPETSTAAQPLAVDVSLAPLPNGGAVQLHAAF